MYNLESYEGGLSMRKFSDYHFKEHTKAFLKLEGFIEPTPIQQEACKYNYLFTTLSKSFV